jgi:hypothetical protein
MNKIARPKTSTIEKKVMSQIKSGKAHMRPRSYYFSISALGIFSAIFLVFTAVYFASVSSLWFRIIAADGPAYGAKRNLATLAGTFPWWALLLGLISLFGLINLVKKLGHMYKVRLVYLIPLIAVLFMILGFALSYTDLPGLMNSGHKTNIVCSIDDLNCNINSRMYGRGRLMK